MNETRITWEAMIEKLPPPVTAQHVDSYWRESTEGISGKIIVLDDDPTGIQTVHAVPVYTDWEGSTIRQIFSDPCKLIFLLTNSRALSTEQTSAMHRLIGARLREEAKQAGQSFHLLSRSDSTLRGHFPAETLCLYEELGGGTAVDAEIIAPFFWQGGRVTINDVHYVREGDVLVPAGETEFAKDTVFGYSSSNLKEWIEEKTQGIYPASQVVSISIDELRRLDYRGIVAKISAVQGFGKIIVNAVDDQDLKVFVIALSQAMKAGRRFMFRTAAGLVQMLGGIDSKPLLAGTDFYSGEHERKPGLVVIGSHVKKTTEQFHHLVRLSNLERVEFDVMAARSEETLAAEVRRTAEKIEQAVEAGKDVCVYTSRTYHQENLLTEQSLAFSNRISGGLVECVKSLKNPPGFLVAKGGITSSDIGVKGLGVRRAMVLGQIQPGVPVWQLGPESKFPGLPYVIFPGNVGGPETLKTVVEILRK